MLCVVIYCVQLLLFACCIICDMIMLIICCWKLLKSAIAKYYLKIKVNIVYKHKSCWFEVAIMLVDWNCNPCSVSTCNLWPLLHLLTLVWPWPLLQVQLHGGGLTLMQGQPKVHTARSAPSHLAGVTKQASGEWDNLDMTNVYTAI